METRLQRVMATKVRGREREKRERERKRVDNHMKDDRCSEKGLMERREKREGLVTV